MQTTWRFDFFKYYFFLPTKIKLIKVAMINESFEEQMKHSLLFTNPNLKSVFYGASETTTTKPSSEKQSPDLGIDEEVFDFKMDISPPPLQFLPNISPPSAGII